MTDMGLEAVKVLFILKNELGRPEQADINYFIQNVAKLGVSVGVICKSGGDQSAVRACNVEVFDTPLNGLSWFLNVQEIIKSFSPNIVHVNSHLGCGVYPCLSRYKGVKFLLDIRSPQVRKGIVRALIVIKNQLEVLGYDKIAGHGIESAQTVIGKWHHGIHWLPPGVDLSCIPLKPDTFKQQEPLKFIYIGSLHRIRKVQQMVGAFMSACKSANITLDIYGAGDMEDVLKQTVRDAKMTNLINFKGLVDRQLLFQRLGDYDVGVAYVPSDLFETAPPLKTMEYMVAGLPVLATDTIGNRLFIRDGENGLLAEENMESFSSAIQQMVAKYSEMKKPSYLRKLADDYDWNVLVASRLIPLYQEMMHG